MFTREACERIAHEAFRLAMQRWAIGDDRPQDQCARQDHRIVPGQCLTVAREYPEVSVRSEHIDALAALLVREPATFDVVAENMFGDILSDLTGQLCGSLGMAPSINASDTKAMAQAAHGAAPDIAGRGIANPVAMISSSAMLLRWLADHHDLAELRAAAMSSEEAVRGALDDGVLTADLGGTATTEEFSDAVVARMGP